MVIGSKIFDPQSKHESSLHTKQSSPKIFLHCSHSFLALLGIIPNGQNVSQLLVSLFKKF